KTKSLSSSDAWVGPAGVDAPFGAESNDPHARGLTHLSERDAAEEIGHMRVTAVMTHPVVTVPPDASIKQAARLLIAYEISALPVVNSAGELVGIVSEADLIPIELRPDPRRQATPIPPTAGSTPTKVSDVMTRNVITVRTNSEVSEAARLMIDSDIKRVPVMQGRKLVGIVSRRDLIKVIARRDEELQADLRQRLQEAGIRLGKGAVTVKSGIATIPLQERDMARRLAESVALSVPGVIEVRFGSRPS
ncbi:MAG TPA: CBS domain-containing protein, partial [Patescibacteria group bacterium]|nr:CBS domain-containing protein [Patescibacteria group bacterium]